MSNDFESTPYDGHHPFLDPGNDWRGGNGIGGIAQRLVSYGNWAGPNNRMTLENREYIDQQRAADPGYSPYHDPKLMNDPRYQAIDGIDRAATRHDEGYYDRLGGKNMFGWEGMRNVQEVDRQLMVDAQNEMDQNGSQYSRGAQVYSQGMRGFFGGRAMGLDAVDFASEKAGEAGRGISNFVDGARNWHSLGDAASGIGQGLRGAGSWLANTGSEAWNGVKNAGSQIASWGPAGIAGAIGGLGNIAVAGGMHLAGQAWDGAKSLGGSVLDGARSMGTGLLNGARSVGNTVMNGARSVGNTVMDGARSVGSTVMDGARSVGGAVAGGARAAGSAVASGAKKLWNWVTG